MLNKHTKNVNWNHILNLFTFSSQPKSILVNYFNVSTIPVSVNKSNTLNYHNYSKNTSGIILFSTGILPMSSERGTTALKFIFGYLNAPFRVDRVQRFTFWEYCPSDELKVYLLPFFPTVWLLLRADQPDILG